MLATLVLLFQTILSASLPEGTVSLQMPDGWHRLQRSEMQSLRPQLKRDSKTHPKLDDDPQANTPSIAITHDYPTDSIAASVQVFASRLPKDMRWASSIEAARVIAVTAAVRYHATLEVEPHETTVAGLPAAEWVTRYQLVETSGATHDMRARNIVITRGEDRIYHLGYAGPAADTADFAAFEEVVRSFKIERTR